MLTYPLNSTRGDLLHLLIFLDLLPGADGAELFSLLIGLAQVVLSHPQMENPNAVDTHKQDGVCHQLTREKGRSSTFSFGSLQQTISSQQQSSFMSLVCVFFNTHS